MTMFQNSSRHKFNFAQAVFWEIKHTKNSVRASYEQPPENNKPASY